MTCHSLFFPVDTYGEIQTASVKLAAMPKQSFTLC